VRIYDRKELSGFLRPNPKELEEGKDYGIWVDLGAYGVPQKIKDGGVWDAKHSIREMEHWTRDNDGWCAVYTDTPSHTLTHPQTPSHTLTHPHTPSHTLTHPHTPSHTLTHPHTPSHTP
jgi:hypothetical protein